MSKQDRQAPRTLTDFERRHNFGESFAEVMGVATDARSKAEQAMSSANNPAGKITHEDVFNLLTDNGALQGIYRGDDGEIYINASYIVAGILKSLSGDAYFDLVNGTIVSKEAERSIRISEGELGIRDANDKQTFFMAEVGGTMAMFTSPFDSSPICSMYGGDTAFEVGLKTVDGTWKTLEALWKPNGDGTYTLIGR
jgi:hypothetical protein